MSITYDLIFRGGTIVNQDGRHRADIGTKDGRIAAIGDLSQADAAVAEAIRSAPSAASREADLTRAARKALHGPLMRVRAGEAVLAEDVRAAVAEALATTV